MRFHHSCQRGDARHQAEMVVVCQAASNIAVVFDFDVVLVIFAALLSVIDSTPRVYRFETSNAAPAISTSVGTFPAQGLPSVDIRIFPLDHA
jgi:hypothetical protein